MKYFLIFVMFFAVSINVFCDDTIKYESIKKSLANISEDQVRKLSESFEGKKITWTGWVYQTQRFDNEADSIVYVDMETPADKRSSVLPDIYFFVPYTVSLKLSKNQKITFSGKIENIDKIGNKYYLKLSRVELVNNG
jgi:hypothetical protein